MKAALAAVCGALALATPASAATDTKPAPPPPPFAGVYQPQGVDEIGMWREDDESERTLTNSPVVIRDEALTSYVKGVLCAAVGSDRCNSTRVYILREPSFGASMSPNGTMRVYSGLLLRMTKRSRTRRGARARIWAFREAPYTRSVQGPSHRLGSIGLGRRARFDV